MDAFQAIVIESSVTATTRSPVGVLGGVRSLAAAEADGAATTSTASASSTARVFIDLSPENLRYFRGYARVTAMVLAGC